MRPPFVRTDLGPRPPRRAVPARCGEGSAPLIAFMTTRLRLMPPPRRRPWRGRRARRVASAIGRSATMRPRIHHGDAVGEREQLLEVLADEEHAAAARAQIEEQAVDELGGADVDAARRLRRRGAASGRARARGRAAPSAGCRRRACRCAPPDPRRGCRNAPSGRRRSARMAPRSSTPWRLKGGVPIHGSAMLSASGRLAIMPVRKRSSGTRPTPRACISRGLGRRPGSPHHRHAAAHRRQHAGDELGELALAVAGNAGDADDLAGAHA